LDVIFGREHERGASLVIAYTAELVSGEPVQDVDEGEVDAIGFFSPDQLPEIAFQATERAIEAWLARRAS
jgi:hypothetical protein